MSIHSVHTVPRWSAVLAELFRTVGIAVRREVALLALLLAGGTLVMVFAELRYPREHIDFVPAVAFPLILLGFLAPMGVWKGEEPSRRSYLWAMPVDRARHTLAKTVAGWAWLMVLVGIHLLWALGMAILTGGEIGVDGIGLPEGARPTGADLHMVWWTIPAWQWLAPFTGATITYLLGSIVVISCDHPWRWYAGIGLFIFLLGDLTQSGMVPWLESLAEGPLRVESAISGTFQTTETITTPNGKMKLPLSMPALGAWLTAMPLWLALGAAGVVAAAYRHQER
ncbi:MAG: Phytoene synthase [uncultured Gemmatimonadetes bacterium]|uniref:Phytoene synthase n=1 Tax=uncultured Gemmatimonadota bacterium TaxID=203437 RepID=A0A6J4K630_9BACT|nr:MAG: Phytoene synthase [uncultured Gemmatimonadota bacterium]